MNAQAIRGLVKCTLLPQVPVQCLWKPHRFPIVSWGVFLFPAMATALVVWAYVTAYITFGIGLLSFVARFVSRRLALGLWGWDDTASCFVMVCQEYS